MPIVLNGNQFNEYLGEVVVPLFGVVGFFATNSLESASKSLGPKDGSLILGAGSLSFEGRCSFTK
jgi:hypothetical protein